MPNVSLIRYYQDDKETLGCLVIEGQRDPIFYTIERPWLNNEKFKSCIPSGTYECILHESPKHGEVYKVLDVAGRTDILMHVANRVAELQGCIGIGESTGYLGKEKAVGDSVMGLANFKIALNKKPFTLTIRG